MVSIYFSDFFDVSPAVLEAYGAFNISLINDLPVFVDPFLLFNSEDSVYRQLHDDIIKYVSFLRDKTMMGQIDDGLLRAWFTFGEVRQNWLGFSQMGNCGAGLGMDFARALRGSLYSLFADFGNEKIARGSHLEKLCLIAPGVGRDNISDFTTNLIKGYLLGYTQAFARSHLRPEFRRVFPVSKVRFNYQTETWKSGRFELPAYNGDFVLLTPRDMLTRDDIWISRNGLYHDFRNIAASVPDEQLRSQLNNYLIAAMPPRPKENERNAIIEKLIREYPAVLEYYIRDKEDNGDRARALSDERVSEVVRFFVEQVAEFVNHRLQGTQFYVMHGDTLEEARERLLFLKDVIENKDGYRVFYLGGKPIQREEDLQILYRLTWFASVSDVNREVNNGRGPVDFKASRGSADKSLIEFKLAKSSSLRRNLEKQVEIYQAANNTKKSLKAIVYFSQAELLRVTTILSELGLAGSSDIVLIDARNDNKPSASKAA